MLHVIYRWRYREGLVVGQLSYLYVGDDVWVCCETPDPASREKGAHFNIVPYRTRKNAPFVPPRNQQSKQVVSQGIV